MLFLASLIRKAHLSLSLDDDDDDDYPIMTVASALSNITERGRLEAFYSRRILHIIVCTTPCINYSLSRGPKYP